MMTSISSPPTPTPSGHQAVLLEQAVAALAIRPEGFYLDATFGRGGHSERILDQLDYRGRLLALDRDPAAASYAQTQFRYARDPRFNFVRGSFAELPQALTHMGRVPDTALSGDDAPRGVLHGALFDLGVSSPQLDTAARGFSFQHDGPLDMRMDPDDGISAAEWLAQVSEQTLAQVLKEYGEERFARRIARAIVAARENSTDGKALTTTRELAELIAAAVPSRERHKHPATRSFQAIRIAINDELGALELGLSHVLDALAPGGRLVIISFHSLEDRRVKRFLRQAARSAATDLPPDLPITADVAARADAGRTRLGLLGRYYPSDDEITANPRARSAVMRVAQVEKSVQ